jgi:hypothetical protein
LRDRTPTATIGRAGGSSGFAIQERPGLPVHPLWRLDLPVRIDFPACACWATRAAMPFGESSRAADILSAT